MIEFLLEDLSEVIVHLDGSLSTQDIQQSAAQYTLVLGSIAEESIGVIQDPAGSAIGSEMPPIGGGLSGAIYRRFYLDPIPFIEPGDSVFNGSEFGKRILHTHSPQLFAVENIWEATRCITRAYLSAITVFVDSAERHGEQVLNLCAVSAGIYAGRFQHPEYQHLHPSITQVALVMALSTYNQRHPNALDPFALRLFYFGDPAAPTPLFTVAEEVHSTLMALSPATL